MALQRKRAFYNGLYPESSDEEVNLGSGGFELEVVIPKKKAKTSLPSEGSRSSDHEGENQSEPSKASDAPAAKRAEGVKNARPPPTLERHNVSDSALLQGRKEAPKGQQRKAASFSSEGTKGTRGKKNKKEKQEFSVRVFPKQIFKGFKFLLLPESTLENHSRQRRLEMQRCRENGAELVMGGWKMGSGITHVILDDERITYQEILKFYQIDAFPAGVVVVNYDYIVDCIVPQIVHERPWLLKYRVKGDDHDFSRSFIPRKAEPSTPQEILGSTETTPSTTSPFTKHMQASHQERAVQISPPAPKNTAPANDFRAMLAPKVEINWRDRLLKRFPQYKAPVEAPDNGAVGAVDAFSLDALKEAIEEAKTWEEESSDEHSEDVLDEDPPTEVIQEEASKNVPKRTSTESKAEPCWQDKLSCMRKNDGKGGDDNPNALTMKFLQGMATHYDKYASGSENSFKATAYRRAISALRQQPELVATRKEALALKSVGESIAQEIEEIVRTKRLRRLEALESDPSNQIRSLFTGIYGVGMQQADIWLARGYRTLSDVKAKATLTENQKVGLEHYDDFHQRIPRDEVTQHKDLMNNVLLEISPDLQCTVGGSYRRDAADSGDIDFLVTSPRLSAGVVLNLVFDELIPRLNKLGYVKKNLTLNKTRRGTKWFGAASLPGSTGPWRRIDIMVAPWSEIGAATLHWTGNDLFNRSMRLLARKKGMTLNEHGLWRDVIRGEQQKKLSQGILVEAHDERKIFAALGVPWLPPEERNV